MCHHNEYMDWGLPWNFIHIQHHSLHNQQLWSIFEGLVCGSLRKWGVKNRSELQEPAVPETLCIWNRHVTACWPCCLCHWPRSQHSCCLAWIHQAELQCAHPEHHLSSAFTLDVLAKTHEMSELLTNAKQLVKYFKHSGLQNSLKTSLKQSKFKLLYIQYWNSMRRSPHFWYERIAQINENTLKTVVAFLKVFKDATNERVWAWGHSKCTTCAAVFYQTHWTLPSSMPQACALWSH